MIITFNFFIYVGPTDLIFDVGGPGQSPALYFVHLDIDGTAGVDRTQQVCVIEKATLDGNGVVSGRTQLVHGIKFTFAIAFHQYDR